MNSKRSYLDSLNDGRQRRPHTTLEQINRSLADLESRLDWTRGRGRPQAETIAPQGAQGRDAWQAARPREAAGESLSPQMLARDLDRLRREEEGAASFGRIATELKDLREELRHQMNNGIRREFEALRKDIDTAWMRQPAAKGSAELGMEFERLSDAIHALAQRSDDKGIDMLRMEMEQVKAAIDTLAREDTVRNVDRRWAEFDHRMSTLQNQVSADAARHRTPDPAMNVLTERLEQISQAVNSLPESLSLHSLEDKVRNLAGVVDHFSRMQDTHRPESLSLIEERLDEISRAIVASSVAAQTPHFDPQPFERIEARITALARQIEEVADDRPTAEIIDRLNLLSRRVDDLAASAHLPDEALERLGRQIAVIADKLDHAPALPDTEDAIRGIEHRFDALAQIVERGHAESEQKTAAFMRDVEHRLGDLALRLDRSISERPSLDESGIMSAIDRRFADFSRQLGSRSPEDAELMRGLEQRLQTISSRLDSSVSQFAGIDPELIRSLESQVSGLSEHLARPSAPLPEFEDIGPRLDDIERSISMSRETVLEMARKAADDAVRTFAESSRDGEAVAGLAQDLRTLEALARRSDERNAKTFEAIHDTLLKIVDRLGTLEEVEERAETAPRKIAVDKTPPLDDDTGAVDEIFAMGPRMQAADRSPQQAAAAAAVAALDDDTTGQEGPSGRTRSMFGGLARAFSRNRDRDTAETAAPAAEEFAPPVSLDEPLDAKAANRPLEPGSGAPDLSAIVRRVRDERGQPAGKDGDAARSDFIAAARRAAQAAAAEAEINKRGTEVGGPVRALRVGDLLRSRRKPLLMAAAAIMIALAGLQLGKAYLADPVQLAAAGGQDAVVQETAEVSAPEGSGFVAEQIGEPVEIVEATGDGDAIDEGPAASGPVRTVGQPPAEVAPLETQMVAKAVPEAPADVVPPTVGAVPPAAEADEPVQESGIAAVTPASVQPAAATTAFTVPAEISLLPLRQAAEAGDPKALFEVGSRYSEGRGVKSDAAEAAKWYERAADLGLAPAQYRIGNFYEKGIGVARDVARSKTWYQLAANQGNASAMHNLAVLFAMGADGVTDNDSAARWFTQAAEYGVKDSQFNLGILAAKGVGMPQSLEESYKWFALVAKAGDRDAATKRDEVAQALRPEQLERARAAVELWRAKPLDVDANSVEVPESWQDGPTTTAGIDMKQAVRNIQAILNKNGYDAGKPDGVMGQRTKTAIAAFQKDNGMQPTGEVDEPLVKALLERK